jgi:hypothetical protein
LPTGLSLNPTTGIIAGVPTVAGSVGVVVTATDGGGKYISQTFSLSTVMPQVTLSNDDLDGMNNFDVQSDLLLHSTVGVSLVESAHAAGKTIKIIDVTDASRTQTLDLANLYDRTMVIFSEDGKSIRINPRYDLDFGHQYRIEVSEGAFRHSSGVGSLALTSVSNLGFTTVTPSDGALAADARGYAFVDTDGNGKFDNAVTATTVGYYDLNNRGDADTETIADTLDFAGKANVAVAGSIARVGAGQFTVNNNYYVKLTGFGADDRIYFDDRANDNNYGTYNDFETGDSPIVLSSFGSLGNLEGNELQIGVTDGTQALIRLSLVNTSQSWAESFESKAVPNGLSFTEMLGALPILVA